MCEDGQVMFLTVEMVLLELSRSILIPSLRWTQTCACSDPWPCSLKEKEDRQIVSVRWCRPDGGVESERGGPRQWAEMAREKSIPIIVTESLMES